MVVHEAVYGSANFRNTWKAKSDKYLKIPSLSFVTGWMLGDIHQRQQISTNAWYSGAPLQIKSDESPSNGILQWIGSKTKFHPLKIRGFRFTNDFDEALKYAKAGHYVRFKGKTPPGVDVPSNIVCDDSIAAIEVDLDYESGSEVGEFKVTIDLIGPLPKFLAARGMQPRHQTMAIEMVSSIIQSRNSVVAEELEDVED
jgi:DNA repair exonuclease SbcCD nuclease subunit